MAMSNDHYVPLLKRLTLVPLINTSERRCVLMKTKGISTLLILISILISLLLACCAPATPSLPNPASVFCQEQGGTLEVRTGDDGSQAGYCIFPDGSECEEWAFFRGECEPREPDEPQIGMPNPASVFCEEQGGRLEVRTGDDGGQAGYCIFPDGSECEEWAFFRGECEPREPDEPQIGMPNPASVFCEEQGGTLEVRTGDDGSQAGYCIFPDGSGCEEWALFHGKCAPKSDYQPLSATACSALADAVAEALDVEVVTGQTPFQDYIGGETGFGCQATATGTGLDFESFLAVADALKGVLEAQGWEADMQYAADGPTGTGAGFHQANGLCLLMVGWEPSEDADCPEDLPISACDLAPEQQLYTIVLHCAQDISTGQ
jgi:putative hemolysin